MVLIHDATAGRTFALDGSSRAPNRATADAFTDLRAERRRGYRAATVPSTPAVLDYVRATYGTLPLADVLQPALRLATDGYEVSLLQHTLARREAKFLRAGTAAPIFLREGKRRIVQGRSSASRRWARRCSGWRSTASPISTRAR